MKDNQEEKSGDGKRTENPGRRRRPVIEIVVIAFCVIAILSFLYVVTGRLLFQYDLEWTEGAILVSALRLVDGLSLYTPPGMDYVPFPYPPGYFSMVAFWNAILGPGFHIGRSVSIFYFFLSIAMMLICLRRKSGVARLTAAGLFTASFAATGGVFDLALPDTAALGLFTVGYFLSGGGLRPSPLRAAFAALFFIMAGFTLQPYLFYGACLLVLMVSAHRPSGIAGLLVFAAFMLGFTAWAFTLEGWPLVYVTTVPVKAFLFGETRFLDAVRTLCQVFVPLIFITVLLKAHRWTDKSLPPAGRFGPAVFMLIVALGSILYFNSSGIGARAFIPLSWLLCMYAGQGMDLASKPDGFSSGGRPLRYAVALAVLFSFGTMLYNPVRHVPAPMDTWVGATMLSKLKGFEGRILIPEHPYSLYLAGMETNYHTFALDMYRTAGMPMPQGFFDPIKSQDYAFVITDGRFVDPEISKYYEVTQNIDIPGDALMEKTGRKSRPDYIMVPRELPGQKK